MISLFIEEVNRIAKIIKPLIKEKNVKILSHFDADGIASAAIIAKLIIRLDGNFQLRVYKQLTEDVISELEGGSKDLLILCDFGSGQLKQLKPIIEQSYVLILDHHEPLRSEHPNLFHLNPLLFGEEEISASMVCYLLSKAVDPINTDLVDLAIIGAVGDMQDENWRFEGTARKLLNEAEMLGKIAITKGLRLYGRNTRPLHKALEYSFNPIIPGITGSESQAVQFLSDLGISIRTDDRWKRLCDLTEEEQKVLASAIIIQRLNFDKVDAANIFGEIYNLVGKPLELQDAREFSTILNACGKMHAAHIGFKLCMGDLSILPKIWTIIKEYKKLISDSVIWVRENLHKTKLATYIFGNDKIPEEIIGTVCSISLNSNIVSRDKPVIGFANAGDKVKVSARLARNLNLNLRDIIVKAAKAVGGEAGGHRYAAGALIDRGKEKEFIAAIEKEINVMKWQKKQKK